jgi:hypothetical protein
MISYEEPVNMDSYEDAAFARETENTVRRRVVMVITRIIPMLFFTSGPSIITAQ